MFANNFYGFVLEVINPLNTPFNLTRSKIEIESPTQTASAEIELSAECIPQYSCQATKHFGVQHARHLRL